MCLCPHTPSQPRDCDSLRSSQTVGVQQLSEATDPSPLFSTGQKADVFDRIDVDASRTISKDEFVAEVLWCGLSSSVALEAWAELARGADGVDREKVTRRDFSARLVPAVAAALEEVSEISSKQGDRREHGQGGRRGHVILV